MPDYRPWLQRKFNHMPAPPYLQIAKDGVLLSIKVQPRASSNQVGPPLGNQLRVRVTAPPVDSAANEALLRLLADYLDCPRNQLELIRGQSSRSKLVKIYGVPAELIARLTDDHA